MVETMTIRKAKRIVDSYCYSLYRWHNKGEINHNFKKKQSINHILYAFKLYHAAMNKKMYRQHNNLNYMFHSPPPIDYKEWTTIHEIIELVKTNSKIIMDYPEKTVEEYEKDYKQYIEIADTKLMLNDELYYDRVYVLIGMKKPIFLLEGVSENE